MAENNLYTALKELDITSVHDVPLTLLESLHVSLPDNTLLSTLAQIQHTTTHSPVFLGTLEDLPTWMEVPLPEPHHTHGDVIQRARELASVLIARQTDVADIVEGLDIPPHDPAQANLLPDTQNLSTFSNQINEIENTHPHTSRELILTLVQEDHPEYVLAHTGECLLNTDVTAEEHIAILLYWKKLWGAQLVHISPFGMTLMVKRRPQSWRDAFELAQEHLDYCPYITQNYEGAALKQHATTLMNSWLWRLSWFPQTNPQSQLL